MSPDATGYAIVIPTIGRSCLDAMLASLAAQAQAQSQAQPQSQAPSGAATPQAPGRDGPAEPARGPVEVVVVDDRPFADDGPPPLDLRVRAQQVPWPVRVLRSGGRGPAAARNVGWRSVRAPWVVFLDDDVLLPPGWAQLLATDLRAAEPDVGGVQSRLEVPLPAHRRPTDWERGTAGLEGSAWITADMAYRRRALAAVHGFDERFPRAYREDADLALRVRTGGWRLTRGRRTTTHPVRPADDWVSLRVQAGSADDALLRALHGPAWRRQAATGRGRLPWHIVTVATAGLALGAAAVGRGRLAGAFAAGWAALTADFARRRIAPGPRPGQEGWAAEWRRMVVTSVAIPFAAVVHRVRGELAHRHGAPAWPPPVRAVLFDRDGTLVHDVPYNGDPRLVRPVAGAREVLDDLRARGIRVGVVSNQSGIGRGLLTADQVDRVDARIEAELGPFDVWLRCPHAPEAGCRCRKPGPAMVLDAAGALGLAPFECAVVGDIGADVDAAIAAGARGVLVPTPETRAEEVAAAAVTAPDLARAVARLVPHGAAPAAGLPSPTSVPASARGTDLTEPADGQHDVGHPDDAPHGERPDDEQGEAA